MLKKIIAALGLVIVTSVLASCTCNSCATPQPPCPCPHQDLKCEMSK